MPENNPKQTGPHQAWEAMSPERPMHRPRNGGQKAERECRMNPYKEVLCVVSPLQRERADTIVPTLFLFLPPIL